MIAGRRRRGRPARPTLAVTITTRDSESRLADVVAHAHAFADEVLVGVDAGSTDRTLDVARETASTVYRFRHSGEISPARMLALEHTECDWLFILDDDEAVDEAMPEVLPELMGDPSYVLWWFPRRWLASTDPDEWLVEAAWFPDWQPRLVRADRTRVWKPVGVHTGLRVVGQQGWEARAGLLHYEPLLLSDEQRTRKLEGYARRRDLFGASSAEYRSHAGAPRAPLARPRLQATGTRRTGACRVSDVVVDLDARPRFPPWGAELEVRMPAEAKAGELLAVTARAHNTGGMRWAPHDRSPGHWPLLSLAYHLRAGDGTVLELDGERYPMPRAVPPGGTAHFVCAVRAPAAPGDYMLEWELVSDLECWFSECGVPSTPLSLRVRP